MALMKPCTTVRGQKALRRQEKEQEREIKRQKKRDRKELYERGLCRDKDGNIGTFQEIGRAGASAYWQNATDQQREKVIEGGRRCSWWTVWSAW